MSTPEPSDSPAGTSVPRHAGVWGRVLANVIDIVILGVPVLVMVSLVLGAESKPKSTEGMTMQQRNGR